MTIDNSAWTDVGDLELLLSKAGLNELLRASGIPVTGVTRTYLRFKPHVGALLGLELEVESSTGKPVKLPGYIRTQNQARTQELAEKWHAERALPTPAGPGIRLLQGGQSLLFLFPNDTRVRGLRFIADPAKLKRILGSLDVFAGHGWRIRARKTRLTTIRYKPERRFILRAKLGLKNDDTGEVASRDVFLRFFADDRARALSHLATALRKQPVGEHIPQPLGHADDGRLLVEEAVEGEEILPRVLDGTADAEELARVLGLLHASQAPDPEDITSTDMLVSAAEAAENLAAVDAPCARAVSGLLARLPTLLPRRGQAATLHGDCHLHQILIAGDRPILVDFERAVRGDPLFDLGHLTAHLEIVAARFPAKASATRAFEERLVSSYALHNPAVDMSNLPFFRACGLVERALLPFRHQEANWRSLCLQRLELALACVEEATTPAAVTDVQEAPLFGRPDVASDVPDMTWETFHLKPSGHWPGSVIDGCGMSCFGILDTSSGEFQAVSPANDSALPDLASWLNQGELIAYRPGRRALVQVPGDAGDRFVKVVDPRKLSVLIARHDAFMAAATAADPGFPRAARRVGEQPDQGAVIFERLPGMPLHTILMEHPEDAPAALEAVATSLASFHRDPPGNPGVSRAGPSRPLRAWVGCVVPHDTVIARDLLATLKIVEALPDGPFGPEDRLVHGDLHDKNIMLEGSRVGLLDLDGLSLGDPTEDIGNLVAHLTLRALQRGDSRDPGREQVGSFLAAYRAAGGEVAEPGIEILAAHTLLRIACLYRFRRRWRHLAPVLLEVARSVARKVSSR